MEQWDGALLPFFFLIVFRKDKFGLKEDLDLKSLEEELP